MNLKTLSLNVLQKALDDICPIYVSDEQGTTQEKIEKRKEEFALIESELDEEWQRLETEYQNTRMSLIIRRCVMLSKVIGRDNSEKIKSSIEKRRDSILKQRLSPKKRKESEENFRRYVKTQTAKVNTELVQNQVEKSKQILLKELEQHKKKFLHKQEEYNNKRSELDLIRLSIEWFEEDFYKVLEFCKVLNLNVLSCYLTVKERIDIIQRDSSKIDLIIEKIKKHDY